MFYKETSEKAMRYYNSSIEGLSQKEAEDGVDEIKKIVKNNWQRVAKDYDISRGQIEKMKPAFRECEY